MAYEVNYDDQRFKDVEADKTEALSELENTYSDMVNNSDKYYQAQVDASKQWEKTQTANQQAQTDFAIEQIEQQKEQAEKDYKKEQSGAYKDWKVESNRYGANAETMAAQGLTNTGYGESSQVAMYNTYQNRVAQARESYNVAVLNYNNAIKDARLQNNSVLAEIAYQALQTQLELSLAGFQYKNQLILDKTNKRLEVDQMYYGRYQDVLNQINTENALAEQVRQFNAQMDYKEASSSKSSKKTGDRAGTPIIDKKPNEISTEYYQGPKNSDADEFGVFSNGYQPKGINGHGKVSKTGKTIQIDTQTLAGKQQTVVQNVWEAEDGTLWYWEGRQNKYIQLK